MVEDAFPKSYSLHIQTKHIPFREKKISVKNNEFILGDISKVKKLSLKTVTYPHGDIDISSCGDKYDILTTQNDDIIFWRLVE